METLAVGIVSRTFFNLPYWIAIENGFLKEEGIETTTTIYGNASQVPPLLSGALHLTLGTPEAVILNAASGGPLRIIAGNTGKVTHSLLARAQFTQVAELRGATIGILNTTEGTFFQVKEMLAAHGLHFPGDYKVKETGGVPPRHKALLEGSIDAGLQSIPWSFLGEDEGLKNLGNIIDYVPDWQFVSINANGDWAKHHSSVAVRFLRAIVRGTEWLYANKRGSAKIAERELPTPLAYAERAWDHYTSSNALTRDVHVSVKGMQKVIETLRQSALLEESAPTALSAYVVEDYLREAQAH